MISNLRDFLSLTHCRSNLQRCSLMSELQTDEYWSRSKWARSIRLFGLVCLMVIQTAMTVTPVLAAEKASGEKLLPKETLVFVSLPDVSSYRDEFQKSSFGKILKDSEFQPILEDVNKKMEEWSKTVEEELGVTLNDLLKLPHGELTFAVTEVEPRKMAFFVLLDYGDSKETTEKLLTEMNEALKDEGAEHTTEEIDDVEVNIYEFEQADPQSPLHTLAYFNEDSYLVLSSDVDAIKDVLDRWDGDSEDTLAANDTFKYCMDRCREDSSEPMVKFFINPTGLIQSALAMAQTVQPQVGMALPFISMLGFDKMKGWGGAAYVNTGDFEATTKSFMHVEAPTGVLKIFQFPATELAPPKWVGSDVSMYFGGNWNVQGAYQAIETMVDTFQGRGALNRQLEQLADRDPGIHIKKDVIDLLDGKFHFVQEFAPSDNESDPFGQRIFFAAKVNDDAKAKKLLSKLTEVGDGEVETREFNGTTVYEVPVPQGDQTMSFAVADGHLVVTNHTPQLESMLRDNSGAALSDSSDFKKIAKHYPAKASMISYAKSDAQLQVVYDLIKNAEDVDFIEGIDLKKLPPFESLKKYLKPSGSYTVPEKKGALSVGFQLKDE